MEKLYHMSRIIFVPQFPAKMRYQEWWHREFFKEFIKHFDEVVVLGESLTDYEDNRDKRLFSPVEQSISFEYQQIHQFLNIRLENDDILFLADISFPGLFSNVLYHKPMKNCFAFCHATSKNAFDYFAPVRKSKWLVETGHSKLFKKVFVATKYHQEKLGWKNTEVVGLPKPPFKTFKEKKIYDIISVSRPCRQKVNKRLERFIEKSLKTKIVRKECSTWKEYYKFLSQGKVLLITTNEDTFGYQALEAVMNNTSVIAPDKFSYPELLPKPFLYPAGSELRIDFLDTVPNLLNQDLINNFYNNIIRIMKEESNE